MALTFGGATSDRVDFPDTSALTDAMICAFAVWVRPTTLTAGRSMASKNYQDGNGGPTFRISGTGGAVEMRYARQAVNAAAISSTTPLVLNTWACLVGVYDPADTQPRIYAGSATAALTEVAYASGTQGSGTLVTTTANVRAGNQGSSAAPATAVQADLAYFLYLVGRVPTLGEWRAWQWRPRALPNALVFAALGFNGVSTQPDWSGHGLTGTITGATLATGNPPLAAPWGYDGAGAYTVTGAATAKPWHYYAQQRVA